MLRDARPGMAACVVVQPVVVQGTEVRALDATIHLFYDLAVDELDAAVASLDELRAMADGRTTCRPLGVHPVMGMEGLVGPYAARLRQILLEVAGADNLVRIAVMRLAQPGSVWAFSAFDVVAGELVPVAIPRLAGATSQIFSLSDTQEHAGELQPEPPGSGIPLLSRPDDIATASAAELAAAGAEAMAIENPVRLDTTAVDCVSCHMSGRVLGSALAVRAFELDDADAYSDPGTTFRCQTTASGSARSARSATSTGNPRSPPGRRTRARRSRGRWAAEPAIGLPP